MKLFQTRERLLADTAGEPSEIPRANNPQSQGRAASTANVFSVNVSTVQGPTFRLSTHAFMLLSKSRVTQAI
jgi:hypothetical protein